MKTYRAYHFQEPVCVYTGLGTENNPLHIDYGTALQVGDLLVFEDGSRKWVAEVYSITAYRLSDSFVPTPGEVKRLSANEENS